MDAISTYSVGNLCWLSIQAFPLIVWPSFICSLLRVDESQSSVLEEYLARSLGFALLALALTVLLVSGTLPLGSSLDENSKDGTSNAISPYASAAIAISAVHHASAAAYCYGWYTWTSETGYLLGALGGGGLATAGFLCVLFAGDQAMVSRYHRFDQSTSGFPFGNSQSYRSKKKAL